MTSDGRVIGTYLHGILHNDHFRTLWLNDIRAEKGLPSRVVERHTTDLRAKAYNGLADVVRSHIDIDLLYRMLSDSVIPK